MTATPRAPRVADTLLFILLGVGFGIVLVKSEIVSWWRIQEMFRFQSFHMYGIMASATLTALVLTRGLRFLGAKTVSGADFHVPRKELGSGTRYWAGGTVFGIGSATSQDKAATSKDRPQKKVPDAKRDLDQTTFMRKKLEAIVHPSAGIGFGYEGWNITMKDGTKLSGIIASKTETDMELKFPGGSHKSIKTSEVQTLTKMKQSMMPEGLYANINLQDVANLLDYLSGLKKK